MIRTSVRDALRYPRTHFVKFIFPIFISIFNISSVDLENLKQRVVVADAITSLFIKVYAYLSLYAHEILQNKYVTWRN